MREIEIKARVASRTALLKALRKEGIELSQPIIQRDQVFGLEGVNGGDDTYSSPWLRIRTETKEEKVKYIFTLKKSVTNQLDSIEHETEVTDPNELEKIIIHSGFVSYSDLTKTRQKATYGELEVCVDTIDTLGDFIEVEKLTAEDADYLEVTEELWDVLRRLNITKDAHVTDGYDVMMRKHLGLEP